MKTSTHSLTLFRPCALIILYIHSHTLPHPHTHTLSSLRLEGYARTKIASVMQPLTEQLLIDQPGDPIEYMVKYLTQNRADLRKHVISETLAVREEAGRRSIPVVDHPLMDKIEELEQLLKLENKFRRKENKAAVIHTAALAAKISELQARLVAAGLPLDPAIDREMKGFDAWDTRNVAASPLDLRDTDDFKFRTFDSLPPMTSKHKSLMKNLLKEEKLKEMLKLNTSFGNTICNMIQAGVTVPTLPYGVACTDSDCPSVFNELYLAMVGKLSIFVAKVVSQGRAAAEGFSPTSLRAHWIGPEGRAAARGPQLPRATLSLEFPADDFCPVLYFGGFLGAFETLFSGSSSVLDHTPFHA